MAVTSSIVSAVVGAASAANSYNQGKKQKKSAKKDAGQAQAQSDLKRRQMEAAGSSLANTGSSGVGSTLSRTLG